MRLQLVISGLAIFCAVPAFAQTELRQLGPHVHGHGRLNIAIEGNQLSMELEVPGADIVGFEHEPTTPEQREALENAKAKLADGLALFKPPAPAGCKLENAKVTVEAEQEHETDADHQHDANDRENEEGEHRHSAFHAEYSLSCQSISRLTSMSFDYFNQFAGAQELDVNVIAPKGQSSYAVTRANPRLDLAGVM